MHSSRTKIIATLGPASRKPVVLRKMILAGLDSVRINCSHASHEQIIEDIKMVRQVSQELERDIAIIADLQGPKIRVGKIENDEVEINAGQILEFTTEDIIGNNHRVSVDYEDFALDVEPGEEILIDDGKLKLVIVETDKKTSVKAKVIYGGKLKSRKGVNLPHTNLSLPSMTDKDIDDAIVALENGVDWIALSFVRQASDVIELKQLIRRKKKHAYVIAKIEKVQAVRNIDEIIREADAIMVARGDLGVEMDFAQVPLIQKVIVEKSIENKKPVIIATQMMESMITNFRPTRAEATDVANAVLDGADTLMLSAETAVGKYPVGVIEAMHRIIQTTESKKYNYNRGTPPSPDSPRFVRDSICFSAARLAEIIGAKAIVTFSEYGKTAYTLSGFRPKADIYAFTRHKHLLSALSLLWGVRAFYFTEFNEINKAINESIKILKDKGFLKTGDYVIHIGSTPIDVSHKTNMLKVTKVE